MTYEEWVDSLVRHNRLLATNLAEMFADWTTDRKAIRGAPTGGWSVTITMLENICQELGKNRDEWRERYNALGDMLLKYAKKHQREPEKQEWEGPEKTLQELIETIEGLRERALDGPV